MPDRAGLADRHGYVDYVAVAAAQYLARGDVATVTLQYSRRPSPLSLRKIAIAREQNRLLWLSILERLRERPGRGREVVLFGESLGAHTSQDVFLHWGTLGPQALGVDRALWIGTPYASKWMHQVTGADRLDVDRDASRWSTTSRSSSSSARSGGRGCGTCCSATTTTG